MQQVTDGFTERDAFFNNDGQPGGILNADATAAEAFQHAFEGYKYVQTTYDGHRRKWDNTSEGNRAIIVAQQADVRWADVAKTLPQA